MNEKIKYQSAKNQSSYMIKRGFIVGLPIMLGYLPVAITYGVLAKQSGLSLIELTMMSVLVFAGASQFMAVNMIAVGAGAIEIIIATFVLNFRHFVMGLSLVNRLKSLRFISNFLLSFGITDELFAVSSINTKESKENKGVLFYISLFLTAYLSWIIGSFLGGLLGEFVPEKLSQSMGIALYAMFIGLLVPSVKKELKVGLIAVIAMLVHMLCSSVLNMSSGWAIVLGTIVGSFSGVYLLDEEEQT